MNRAHFLIVLIVLGVLACHNRRDHAPERALVPAKAPNVVPWALFDSLGTVRAPSGAVPFVRSIVAVTFKLDATVVEREAAVRSIDGTVVGGMHVIRGDGEYYVRIAGTTFEAIQAAVGRLRTLPQVQHVFGYMVEPDTFGPSKGPPPQK